MTFTREVTIWCDGEGCGLWEQAAVSTAARLRRILKKQGWSRSGKNDYCPSCTLKCRTAEQKPDENSNILRFGYEAEDPVPSKTR